MSFFAIVLIILGGFVGLFLMVLFVGYFQSKVKSTFDESNEAYYKRGHPGLNNLGELTGELVIVNNNLVFKKLLDNSEYFRINVKDIKNVEVGFLDASDFAYSRLGPLAMSIQRRILKIEYQDGEKIYLVELHTRSKILFKKIKEEIDAIKTGNVN